MDLAPVLDVPDSEVQFMTPRAFGSTPEQVSRLGLAFADGLQSEGVAATAKHFPGLGRAVENTDFAPTQIEASRAVVASMALDDPCARDDVIECNVRYVMFHMIQETARHAGHADIIRETLDGTRGI